MKEESYLKMHCHIVPPLKMLIEMNSMKFKIQPKLFDSNI
jgi:hypothetical protein